MEGSHNNLTEESYGGRLVKIEMKPVGVDLSWYLVLKYGFGTTEVR